MAAFPLCSVDSKVRVEMSVCRNVWSTTGSCATFVCHYHRHHKSPPEVRATPFDFRRGEEGFWRGVGRVRRPGSPMRCAHPCPCQTRRSRTGRTPLGSSSSWCVSQSDGFVVEGLPRPYLCAACACAWASPPPEGVEDESEETAWEKPTSDSLGGCCFVVRGKHISISLPLHSFAQCTSFERKSQPFAERGALAGNGRFAERPSLI
jgi:hypothetical protein